MIVNLVFIRQVLLFDGAGIYGKVALYFKSNINVASYLSSCIYLMYVFDKLDRYM